ncbi:MAG: MATE family efflux transporter [Sphaerochaetaceae bacterium]|nr:MATE family efflux transporter [Sphaerochaetaceae bacterium]
MNKDLTIGREDRVIWAFTLPLLGSMIFQQLYNLADSFVAGKFIGQEALAAVGNSYEITLIFIAIAFGCNMGCSIVVSQLYGAKRMRDVKTAIYTTFVSVFVMVVVLSTLGLSLLKPLLRLIHTPQETFSDSVTYLRIYIYGLAFLFYYNIATGIFSAMGDSRTPFVFLVFSSTANIFMDILFVIVFKMGVRGVAWATFICQGVAGVLANLALVRRLRGIATDEKANVFDGEIFRRIVRVAVPSMMQQSFVSVGNIMIQSVINSFGAVVMAGYAASIKINNLVIQVIMTIGNGVSSFTGQNIGAGKLERVYKGRRAAMRFAFPTLAVVGLLLAFFSRYPLSLFMQSNAVDAMRVGQDFFKVVGFFYIPVAMKIITDGVIRGSGDMRSFLISTLMDLFTRVVLVFILSGFLGPMGIWISWPFGWLLGTALSLMFYTRGRWKTMRI